MSSSDVQLDNPYGGYIPSLPTAVVFIAIFGLSSLVFLYQIFAHRPRRMLWMLVFPICGLVEIIGWGGRLWSHFSIYGDGYLMQICCLTIAPTFISAGLYMLLGVLIQRIAPQHSWLSGTWFKIVFVVADVVSLVVQAVGGALAASSETESGTELGGRIMLGGIAFQLFVMIVFAFYAIVWTVKARKEIRETIASLPGGQGISRASLSMSICSTMIILRGFYRSVELGDGFRGSIATNEPLFLLDAIPVAIAMFVVNALPPQKNLSSLYDSASYPKCSSDSILMAEQGGQTEVRSSAGTLVGNEATKGY
ncbi:RTA1 like protein-domain-containing protein [Leucosporidium creatinivorum]|uniref:RTA1 like protein-domain-containing protein n=1 Tax=Leucosporidium creatinivorum TaxID=106004 RepID=A0A1Y2CLY9_9BASI|nr:RTA1 like protein-domain-containing protein [Leucosporidium creatinivorum]